MTEKLIFAGYPVFKAIPDRVTELDRQTATKEVASVFEEHADSVAVRGCYSTAGFTSAADLMFWWVADSADDIQDLTIALRRTRLGRALEHTHMFLGLVRSAEFAKDHLPAFVQGKEPKKYASVYPYVRTEAWYLLPAEERRKYLREHGEAGREFPDVLANTTSAFGLNDYEWILAFEADTPDRIVELIHHLRGVEARRYTKLETPFITGIRKELADAISDLF
jgi:chlorite dismutase